VIGGEDLGASWKGLFKTDVEFQKCPGKSHHDHSFNAQQKSVNFMHCVILFKANNPPYSMENRPGDEVRQVRIMVSKYPGGA
jgi:hypothetical protein